MSNKLNRTLYKTLQITKNKPSATIERAGDEGAVILTATVEDKYETWLMREFPETQTAEAYLRSIGRIENGLCIEEDKRYRPADENLAWDFDAGASVFLERWYGADVEEEEEEDEDELLDNLTMPF